jgi:hypothetical protein
MWGQWRYAARRHGRSVLGAIALVLALSGVAVAALGKTPAAPRSSRVVSVSIARPRVLADVVPPTAAPVPAPTNRAAVYVPPPASSSPPTISGEPFAGEVLTEGHGAWSSAPTSYRYQWERCSNAGGACDAIAQASEQAYRLQLADIGSSIRVQEIASNGSGAGSPVVSSVTAAVRAAPVAVPVLGRRGVATAISGIVRIRLKGSRRFVLLSGSASIPIGSEVDATSGRVRITVATRTPGKTADAEVYAGVFVFLQNRNARALARLILSLPLSGCLQPRRGANGRKRAAGAKRQQPHSRRLWVSEHGGNWGSTGRYVSTTVQGTRWLTLDKCYHSEVRVAEGRVRVRNLITGVSKVLSAGMRSLVAPPPGP